jgi:hypothetical protein
MHDNGLLRQLLEFLQLFLRVLRTWQDDGNAPVYGGP